VKIILTLQFELTQQNLSSLESSGHFQDYNATFSKVLKHKEMQS